MKPLFLGCDPSRHRQNSQVFPCSQIQMFSLAIIQIGRSINDQRGFGFERTYDKDGLEEKPALEHGQLNRDQALPNAE